MVLWFIYFLLSLVCMILCYITNPIAVLFANEDGELPGVLKYWQTWDNSVYCQDGVMHAPKFLQYDWAKHYVEYKDSDSYLRSVNRERWYCVCINYHFTVWEQIQRYLCGVLWLTRNCSYGFAFYLLGLNVSPNLDIRESEHTCYVREVFGGREIHGGGSIAFMYKNTAPIFSAFGYVVHWNNLIGWKIDTDAKFDTRAMIANRIAFFFEKEGE